MAVVEARVRSTVPYLDGVETTRDPCAVVTTGLAVVVRQFVSEFGRRAAGSDVDVLTGAIQELVRRTDAQAERLRELGVAEARGVSDKTIRSILREPEPTYETTDLRTADALVTAAGRPFVLHGDSIVIVQNERALASVRTRCCGRVPAESAPTLANYRDSLNGSLSAS